MFSILAKLLTILIIFKKKGQNQANTEATMYQRVNGHLKKKPTVTYDLASTRLVKKLELIKITKMSMQPKMRTFKAKL